MSTNLISDTVCIYDNLLGLNVSPANAVLNGTGVVNGSFDPQIAGVGLHTITATFTDSNSCQGSSSINIYVDGCSSFLNHFNSEKIQILPNPNMGSFIIQGLLNGQDFSVYDMNGKTLYKGTSSGEKEIINIQSICNGVYYIRIKSETQFIQVKFIVYK